MTDTLVSEAIDSTHWRRVAVTGANGFVGRVVCRELAKCGAEVTALVRSPCVIDGAARISAVGDFTAVSDWRPHLQNIDALVHLAALTHDGTRGADAARFHAVNVEVSRRLVQAARAQGIARLVYLSSIKVNGEASRGTGTAVHAYSAADVPAPEDDYGRSKLAAERALSEVCGDALALTVLRPPLVYGPGQRGNLPRLMRWVASEWPIPLGALRNRRSLIYVDNLAAAVICALGVATPGVRCYTVADVDVSTAQLVEAMAAGLGVRAHLVAVPPVLLAALTHLPVLGPRVRRLTDSLLVDARAIENELGWHPRVDFEQAMALTCASWRDAQT